MGDYDYDEKDIEGGGGGSLIPVGDYTVLVEKAKVKNDKNGKPSIRFQAVIMFGSQKKRKVFENYLPLAKLTEGKGAGSLHPRTKSFLRAIGYKGGIPIGAPGGADISNLEGTYLDVRVEHEYQNVPGHKYAIVTWQKEFKELSADPEQPLRGIKPRESLGFYSVSDEFEGVGANVDDIPAPKSGDSGPKASAPSNAPAGDSGADEEDWG